MYKILLVAFGGALGAALRYGTHVLFARFTDGPLPLGTWTVNLAGCFLIGLLAPIMGRAGLAEQLRFFLIVGFLGSLTTFSTFTLETLDLWERGLGGGALVNAVGSLILGLLFVWLGLQIGRAFG